MVDRSLEDLSVQILTEVSEQRDSTPAYFLPSPRITHSCFRLQPMSRKPQKPVFRRQRRQSDIPSSVADGGALPNLRAFKLFAKPSKYRCKCMFLGGGGFINTNAKAACDSSVCVNRIKRRINPALRIPKPIVCVQLPADRVQTPSLAPLRIARISISRSSVALRPR
jgi:hypothetical protein